MLFQKKKESVSTMATKEFDVMLPPGLAKNENLDKATVKVEENQIIIQIPSTTSLLPELWVYVPSKARWSIFKFRT